MEVKFQLRACNKSKKTGMMPLEMRVSHNGERKCIYTGYKFKELDEEFVDSLRVKAYKLIAEMNRRLIDVNIDSFLDVWQNGLKSSTMTLLVLFDDHIEFVKEQANRGVVSSTLIYKFKMVRKNLTEFLNDKDIMLCQITPQFFEDFKLFLLKSGCNNTAIEKLKRVKLVLNKAVDEGYIDRNPFKLKMVKDKVEQNPLTEEELKVIELKEIKNDRLSKVRDLFVFACYTGLSFGDLKSLSKDNLKDDCIIKNRLKTNVKCTIPLLPKARAIWEKYDWKLPVLSNQKYNSYLQEIGNICGIDKQLHSHLARHTFATIMLNKGVPMVMISRMLGHTSTKITESTYAELLTKTIVDTVNRLNL